MQKSFDWDKHASLFSAASIMKEEALKPVGWIITKVFDESTQRQMLQSVANCQDNRATR
jgi:hypothetical protein